MDVTWTGGSAGTFLDALALAGRPAVQGSGVGATPAPLLPPPTTDSTAGRPCGPRGPATVHCSCAQCKGEGETNTASQDYPTSTRIKTATNMSSELKGRPQGQRQQTKAMLTSTVVNPTIYSWLPSQSKFVVIWCLHSFCVHRTTLSTSNWFYNTVDIGGMPQRIELNSRIWIEAADMMQKWIYC